MSVLTVDFARLAKLEPRLASLATFVGQLRPEDDGSFCGGMVWERLLKPQLRELVGWNRGARPLDPRESLTPPAPSSSMSPLTEAEELLRSERAWDVASIHLLGIVAPCSGCGCL